jgi:hypothetical protein
MCWADYVAGMEEMRNRGLHKKLYSEKRKMSYQRRMWQDIINIVLKIQDMRMWIGFSWLRLVSSGGFL